MFLKTIQTKVYTTDETIEIIKQSKQLSAEDWVKENRWLLHQTRCVKQNILVQFHALGLALSKIEMNILVDMLYDYCMTDSMSTSDHERFVAFKLPIRSHNMLLKKIYTRYHEENNHTDQCAQKQNQNENQNQNQNIKTLTHQNVHEATCNVFQNVISLMTHSQFIFQRGHLLFFYESLFTLYYELSDIYGHSSFVTLSECVACIPSLLRQSALTGYKLSMFKRIHKTIILSLFKSLCIYGHFKNIDTLFHYHRVILRGKVQKWILHISKEDASAVWTSCEHIKQFCMDNALKWRQLRTMKSPIWTLCLPSVCPELLHIEETDDCPLNALYKLSHNNIQQLHMMLKTFTKHTHSKIILNIVQFLKPSANKNKQGSNYEQEQEQEQDHTTKITSFYHNYMIHYQKSCLTICENNPSLIMFYSQQGQDPETILCSFIKVVSISEKHLQQWCNVHHSIPLIFFKHIIQRVSTCLHIQQKKNTDLNNKSLRLLNALNTMLSNVMKFDIHQYNTHHIVLECIYTFLQSFKDYVSLYRPSILCKLICYVVCICFMEQLPTTHEDAIESNKNKNTIQILSNEYTHVHEKGDDDVPCEQQCAICYNDITAPLHVLPCGHVFHTQCIAQSIQYSSYHKKDFSYITKCPYCMKPILPKETMLNECSTASTSFISVAKWLYEID